MNPDLLLVLKEEHHYWSTCPCGVCEEERKRRSKTVPANKHIKVLTPEQAEFFGFIPKRNPLGSLAKQLTDSQESK